MGVDVVADLVLKLAFNVSNSRIEALSHLRADVRSNPFLDLLVNLGI